MIHGSSCPRFKLIVKSARAQTVETLWVEKRGFVGHKSKTVVDMKRERMGEE